MPSPPNYFRLHNNNEESTHDSAVDLPSLIADNPRVRFDSDEGQEIEQISTALISGGAKTYIEKVKLCLDNCNLFLLILFPNGLRRFWDIQHKLLSAIETNFYYQVTIPEEIRKPISYDGATISSEAFTITTPLVLLAISTFFIASGYQTARYVLNRKERKELIRWLNEEKNYKNATQLPYFSLSSSQIAFLREKITQEEMNANTVLPTQLANYERFATDMQWYLAQTSKYTTPLIGISLIPGFILMFRSARDLDGKIDCGMFPLWALFVDGCSVTAQYEVMSSLLTYMWDCLSITWLGSRWLAISTRMLMIPCPRARLWIEEKINAPFSLWWDDQDKWLYNALVGKMLFTTTMPAILIYALYTAGHFVNEYAEETGCSSLGYILKSFFLGNHDSDHRCSTAQISMAISGFLGDFEIGKLYASYIAINIVTSVTAFVMKRLPYFKRDHVTQKTKDMLQYLVDIENKAMYAGILGVVFGGIAGFLPATRIANGILNEGFEVYFHFDNNTIPLLANISIPSNIPNMDRVPIIDLLKHPMHCTVSSIIRFPGIVINDTILPGFNQTVDCIEFLDKSTMGLQITPPCPDYTIFSIFLLNLFGLAIDCDPVLVIRGIAGFVAPYWLSVSTSTLLSIDVAMLLLLSFSALQLAKNRYCKPVSQQHSADIELQQNHGRFSQRLFTPRAAHRSQPGCFSRLKNKVSLFFNPPSVVGLDNDHLLTPNFSIN